MKIIDLLNRIAKGEEVPNEIKWFDKWKDEELTYIFDKKNKDYERIDLIEYLFNDHFMTESLNDEIEIIEEVEDKEYEDIEEMNLDTDCTCEWNFGEVYDTINALIRNQKYILERLDKND